MIPFFIIFGLVISIIIKVIKGVGNKITSAIDSPAPQPQPQPENIVVQKPEYVFCEYCGTKQSVNQTKCSSCGAKITSK